MNDEHVRRCPCLAQLPNILTILKQYEIACLSGPLGSSFNIAVPPFLTKDNKVILVEPTEEQAIWTAEHIGNIFSDIKLTVYPKQDPCNLYIVPLVAFYQETLRMTQNEPTGPLNLLTANYLFIDQANLLLAEMDLIQDIWRNIRLSNPERLCRLVLITNTIESLDDITILKNASIPVGRLQLPFRKNNSISYLDADTSNSLADSLILGTINAIRSKGYKPKMDHGQAVKYVTDFLTELYRRGMSSTVMVMVPGRVEAEILVNSLSLPSNVKLVKAYNSDTDVKELYTDKIKLIVATDLFNATATLEQVALIVDLVRVYRRQRTSSDKIEIEPSPATKVRSDSIASRGVHCFRIITSGDYNGLPVTNKPELITLPLYFYLLDFYRLGLSPSIITRFTGSYHKLLEEAIKVLQDLGVIQNNQVTEKGKLVKSFSLSLRNNLVLLEWINQRLPPYVAIVILCMIEGRPYWWYTANKKEQSSWDQFRKYSDVETLTNLWLTAMNSLGGPTAQERQIWDWCKNNFINSRRFVDVLNQIKRITVEVNNFLKTKSDMAGTQPIKISHFSLDNAIKAMKQVFIAGYSDRVVTLLDPISRTYTNPSKSGRFVLDNKAVSEMWKYPAKELIALGIYSIGRQGSNSYNLALSINLTDKPEQSVTSRQAAPSEQEVLAMLGGPAGTYGFDVTNLVGSATPLAVQPEYDQVVIEEDVNPYDNF